ncbi:phytase [Paenibacillus radicis (ex Xue et al. 2023)]|uniref:Phytase n=1 Tax=Paenibacillus radicis (ex Xue et al. 2023) TaxID=2972489 RepID=A0ABT1YTZ9_9BACL|nr:phytase [Paenibacillus radicis (ex Xue et al. 2023)]MCR8635460.1 phytase [Paenibacillus radicis (ex Xue et al. 2023)]
MKLLKSISALAILSTTLFYSTAFAADYEPLREILQSNGASVVWDANTNSVLFKLRNGKAGSITIGSDEYTIGSKTGKMQAKAALIKGVANVSPDLVKILKLENAGGVKLDLAKQSDEKLFTVTADVETDAVDTGKDAADDPSIWVNPTDPAKSRIIATNKGGGVLVYDLSGKQLYSYPVGKVNNIDVRYDFPLAGKKIDITATTNRSSNTVDIFAINPETGELTNIVGDKIKSKMPEVYGFSLYHSLKSGKFYALVLGHDGEFEQWELADNGSGKINGKLVRELSLGTISEGLVADDEYGYMYFSEENIAIWKFDAEPTGGLLPVGRVDVADGARLTTDIEGLTIYYANDGKGYLIASSQGSDRYVLYSREGNNSYVASFQVGDGKYDGTSETDGIDVLSFGLGKQFPNGIFITQDDENITDGKTYNQNFKIVPWDKIADGAPTPLLKDNKVDPRSLVPRSR